MKKTSKKATARMGRPPKGEKSALKSLGSVRVTEDQIATYDKAAAVTGSTRADWIRQSLDIAARRALKR